MTIDGVVVGFFFFFTQMRLCEQYFGTLHTEDSAKKRHFNGKTFAILCCAGVSGSTKEKKRDDDHC